MRPKVIQSVNVDGEKVMVEPEVLGQPITAKTAAQVSDMMVYAASKGEAQWTASKQYSIAGKTGTAQIPVAGHYDEDKTIASFIGFAPASDPQFMQVNFENPNSQWASETAAPLWYDIAKELLLCSMYA
jgi:cell division protein FtsI/penicillin-binding protein 2